MKKATKKIASVPEIIVYTQIELPSAIPPNEQSFELFKENIALQTQGEPVEMSEEYSTPLLMAAFEVIHKTSPEAILRLKTGEQVLLFDHQSVPVLRDENIIVQFSKIGEHEPKNDSDKFSRECHLNLELIWNKEKNDDYFAALKNALEKIQKIIKPAMVTTIIGKAPALLFLLTQHQLYGKTGEIWYQESPSSIPIRITQRL